MCNKDKQWEKDVWWEIVASTRLKVLSEVLVDNEDEDNVEDDSHLAYCIIGRRDGHQCSTHMIEPPFYPSHVYSPWCGGYWYRNPAFWKDAALAAAQVLAQLYTDPAWHTMYAHNQGDDVRKGLAECWHFYILCKKVLE